MNPKKSIVMWLALGLATMTACGLVGTSDRTPVPDSSEIDELKRTVEAQNTRIAQLVEATVTVPLPTPDLQLTVEAQNTVIAGLADTSPTPPLLPSPTQEASLQATPSSQPAPTATVGNAGSVTTPTTCSLDVDPQLSGAWDIDKLGCPTAAPNTVWAAWQPFERGYMFWRDDTDSTYVLNQAAGGNQGVGQWRTPPDGAQWDGSNPNGVGLTPPPGLYEPIRGFGWLWREYLGREQSDVGWALDQEKGFCATLQPFERGLIFRSSSVEYCQDQLFNWARDPSFTPILITLYSDGSWQRF
jgi:hypothetical protein